MDRMNFFGGAGGLGFSKEDLIERLEQFCNDLVPGGKIIVIGASAIILSSDANRQTYDIDILNTIKSGAYAKYDIQIVNQGILFLLPDYEERLTFIFQQNGVSVYALGLLDVALVKLGRGLDKDLNDIKEILGSGKVSSEEFIDKYKEFREWYGGSYYVIDSNFEAVTGIKIEPDKRMF